MYYLLAALIGLVSGITSGLFGVGGGVVIVPATMLLMKLDIKMAVGTSLAVIVPTAVIGALKHHHHGHVQWPLVLALLPLAMAGGWLGAWATTHISSGNLKRGFGVFLVFAGLRLVFFK